MEQKERRQYARQVATEYMKPIYGFALKRTSSLHDAEDLTQEICFKLYRVWTLVFYILAFADEGNRDDKISFEEAATLRKDGGQYIAHVSLQDDDIAPPKYWDSMKKWCGPCWNGIGKTILWQIDSEWSGRRVDIDTYGKYIERDIKLLERFTAGEALSADEYAYMVQKGYIKGNNGDFRLAIVWIEDQETRRRLLEIGNAVNAKHRDKLKALKDGYIKLVMDGTPKHLWKMRRFEMQYIFYADGWFLLYSAKYLLKCGKLQLLDEEQRKSMTMLLVTDK